MKKIFLVDTENVNALALQGACGLSKDDLIILFITQRTGNHSFSHDVINSLNINASIQRVQILTGGKNSLDFQLVTYLGLLIGGNQLPNTRYYIISKDKGFLSSINLLSSCSNTKVELISDIKSLEETLPTLDESMNISNQIQQELKSMYRQKTILKAITAYNLATCNEDIRNSFLRVFNGNLTVYNQVRHFWVETA